MPNSGLQNIYIMYGDSIPNYFNRRILFYGSLEDYLTAAGDNYELHEEVNFNPADGVNTYLDVVTDMGDKFSYLLLVDPEDGTILSRWFILEADRNLGGQYRFTLRRDVVAESLGNTRFITSAPVYVEKGILQENDPMIVNPEGLTFNQIKRNENLLYQAVNWGYIVGYFEKGASANFYFTIGDSYSENTVTIAEISAGTGIPVSKLNDLFSGTPLRFSTNNPSLVFGLDTNEPFYYKAYYEISNNLDDIVDLRAYTALSWHNPVAYYEGDSLTIQRKLLLGQTWWGTQSHSDKLTAFNNVISNDTPGEVYLTASQLTLLRQYVGRVITIDGVQKEIKGFQSGGISDHAEVVISKNENTLFNQLASEISSGGTQLDDWDMYLNYKCEDISVNLSDYAPSSGDTLKINIPVTARTLKDAPYSMFVIPYGDYHCETGNGTIRGNLINKETALRIANEIAIQLADKLYDIQLLPYNPSWEYGLRIYTYSEPYFFYLPIAPYVLSFIDEEGTDPTDITFSYILNGNDEKISAILFPNVSNFTVTINKTLTATDNAKIESQCNFYRLCSPNYNGVFEFNLAKNGMSVDSFLIDCTYKPFNPLIRIQPSFKGLYGTSFTDGRGLICGGDFSLPIIKDAWITYQQNNKNFASMFARDIENLDVAQRQEKIKEAVTLGSGVVGGGAAGAVGGAKIGGVYGAIAGAAAGTAIGGIGAAIDAQLGGERRAEAKDYAIDRFNMNLGNIKALPQTLARNSSFTTINKIFPFLEYYSCTQEEKDALQRKITYDGMTVGRIDFITNFTSLTASNYFKGQLIRAEGLEEDTHYINALYDEIAKGVYI